MPQIQEVPGSPEDEAGLKAGGPTHPLRCLPGSGGPECVAVGHHHFSGLQILQLFVFLINKYETNLKYCLEMLWREKKKPQVQG